MRFRKDCTSLFVSKTTFAFEAYSLARLPQKVPKSLVELMIAPLKRPASC
jgi:hypothetical protein